MNCRVLSTVPFALALAASLPAAAETAADARWPQFRGINGAGVGAANARPPIKVGPTENVLWKVEVPWSPGSPAIWGDHLFLDTFNDGQLETRCYDRSTGKLLWTQGVKPAELEPFHRTDGSPAAGTPALDAKHVVSYFGSFGVLCYDHEGKELWRHPLPLAVSGGSFGSGTSPIIAGDRVILNRDQDKDSTLLALDLTNGKTLWETSRPDARGSFGTPIIWENNGTTEVVQAGTLKIRGYDLISGAERWVVEGLPAVICPTPTVGDGMLYFAGWAPGSSDSPWPSWAAFRGQNDKNGNGTVEIDELPEQSRDFQRALDVDRDGKISEADWKFLNEATAKSQNVMVAIKPGGKGNISETHVAWKYTRGLPYVPSALFYDGRVYVVKDGGMMTSVDAKTGTAYYSQERLGAIGSYYASPVAAAGRIYVASLPGKLMVVKAGGDKPEILHQADFGERIFASAVPVEDKLYLRTQNHLWAFSER